MQKRNDAPRANSPAQRLAWLVERHSQAEVARKAGVPPPTVYRYLRGAKIPADFCAALVKQLDVNPAWFLVGEGTPYLSDISAGDTAMAGDLLAVVEAMNAVSQMRLGSLAGKHHLKVLRELDEAMKRHDALKERLNVHTRPLFRQLNADLHKALKARDFDRASGLLQAAHQVSRLCDDDELQTEFVHLRGSYEYYHHNLENAISHDRAYLMRLMARGGGATREVGLAASDLAITMRGYRMTREARRICRSVLAMDEGEAEFAVPRERMNTTLALAELDLDNLRASWDAANNSLQFTREDSRPNQANLVARHLMYSGLAGPSEAMQVGGASRGKNRVLLRFVCWLEDAGEIKRVLAGAVGPHPPRIPEDDHDVLHASCLLEALAGKADAALQRHLRDAPKSYPRGTNAFVNAFEHTVANCQLERLALRRRQALASLEQADKALRAVPPRFTTLVEIRATHWRNMLALADGEAQRRAAREFFAAKAAAGFHCFNFMLSQPAPARP